MNTKGSAIGGSLIVAGTCIGGGMLGLPILTGMGGFLPSVFIYLLCWMFMVATGLLLVEVCLWMGPRANLISMAERTLGFFGKAAAWGLYLFLFYSLTTAYCVGSADLVQEFLGESVPAWLGMTLVLSIFGPMVALGAAAVDRLNRVFVVGMFVTLGLFLTLGLPQVRLEHLVHQHWGLALLGLPVVFTSFGFQGTVPSLVHYLEKDSRRLRLAIIGGSLIPLLSYIVWQAFILGILSQEQLDVALKAGQNSVRPLKNILGSPWVYSLGQYFAFFALISSFLGVTLGLSDFLADGLKIKKDFNGRILLGGLVFLPPFIFALIYPNIFLIALHHAGGLGVALLLGLLPVLMVWRGRYHLGLGGEALLPGGRVVLLGLILFVVMELVCEGLHFFL